MRSFCTEPAIVGFNPKKDRSEVPALTFKQYTQAIQKARSDLNRTGPWPFHRTPFTLLEASAVFHSIG